MLRFTGFELDPSRAELRGPDGAAIRLRHKTFELLYLLAKNSGQVLSKEDLMAAVWPNVHVGDGSLFQCIRELRKALGDERRELIKVVSGRGYRLDADVMQSEGESSAAEPQLAPAPAADRSRLRTGIVAGMAAAGVAVLGAAFAIAGMLAPPISTIAIMPIASTSDAAGPLAAAVTRELTDGLSRIGGVKVFSGDADAVFVVTGELEQSGSSWVVDARMTRAASKEVVWAGSAAVDSPAGSDPWLLESRLGAGVGHELALKLNSLFAPMGGAKDQAAADTARVLVEQATDYLKQTSKERFGSARDMLEAGLAADPDNVDIKVALAGVLLRGVQLGWHTPGESAEAQERARAMLEQALRTSPNSIAVQDAWCRYLAATNAFNEGLVACARALNLNPWDGIALYHLGLAQLQLGRFEDAMATFTEANAYDTPAVSRWTWVLGVGWTHMLMGRSADALPWLERTIAITPASGRVYLLLAAAYHDLGRPAEAAAAMAKALEFIPTANAINVRGQTKNASPVFLAAVDRLIELGVAAGLPEQ